MSGREKSPGYVPEHCQRCIYFAGNTYTCDYYLLTGAQRKCSPTTCNRFVEGKRTYSAAESAGMRLKRVKQTECNLQWSAFETGFAEARR